MYFIIISILFSYYRYNYYYLFIKKSTYCTHLTLPKLMIFCNFCTHWLCISYLAVSYRIYQKKLFSLPSLKRYGLEDKLRARHFCNNCTQSLRPCISLKSIALVTSEKYSKSVVFYRIVST